MKDGVRAEQPPVSRQDLYRDYVSYYTGVPVVKPCSDPALLEKAAQFLLGAPEPTGTYTVFPFHRILLETPNVDFSKHLRALSKATEVLETLCLNLFLQPWKKEIKTLKTYTGPFVYGLLPALSSSTLQSVLASIGYLPHPDHPQRQYTLSEDTNPDRAIQVGFELLLARVECCDLLKSLEQDQPGPQDWHEILQRRARPVQTEEPEEKKTVGEKEEEVEEQEQEGEDKKMEEAGRKEVEQLATHRVKRAVKPRPLHRRRDFIPEDKSIMEMQLTYPDLAIKGRPLLRHNRAAFITALKDGTAGPLSNSSNSSNAADIGKPGEVFRGDCCDGTSHHGDDSNCSVGSSDGGRPEGELSGPKVMSLHLTLRAGTNPEPSTRPGESQPTEPPTWTERKAASDMKNKVMANTEDVSRSFMEEEEELRGLAERMAQEKGETEEEEGEEEEERDLYMWDPVEDRNTVQSHVTGNPDANRSKRSSQLDPGAMKGEQQSVTNFETGTDENKQEGEWIDPNMEQEEVQQAHRCILSHLDKIKRRDYLNQT
ncbi:uncharacterized protein LOC143011119 [Genypterus blacodes]|uniref:uncharacterized protein LOC143011119 n=1 Tax=Genypterus blacodes TaxID=154954 RepID=UPI003F76BBF2